MSLMWSWHWSPHTQTSLLLSPSDGLASFLKTTLANGIMVVKKVITSKFRFHLIAIYALGCFAISAAHLYLPKLPWRALPPPHSPTPVRLVQELILMLLIKKTINLFFIKKMSQNVWASDSNFLLAQIFFFRPSFQALQWSKFYLDSL